MRANIYPTALLVGIGTPISRALQNGEAERVALGEKRRLDAISNE